jgi:membrane-bound metal-dependent hydrolase YbcI (DUF457 family)
MFVGHYSASFAAKRLDPGIPLWLLFLAVQLLDVVWSILVILGVEKVRIVPGITASSPLDLYYMPYTHSLIAAVIWSGLAFAAYLAWRRSLAWKSGALIAAAVFSHWLLDLIVHRPDLPLYDNTAKVGLGLWNYPAPAFLLEAALLFGGMLLYLRATVPVTPAGRYGMIVFGIVLLALNALPVVGPPPPSPNAAAVTALSSYIVFAAIAAWLERKRQPVKTNGT